MSTVQEITKLQHRATADRPVYSPLEAYWKAFQEWRKRRRLQTESCRLTDREQMDTGTTRGEIDYVVSNRDIDPRGMRAEWVQYLPTVDGQIHPHWDKHPQKHASNLASAMRGNHRGLLRKPLWLLPAQGRPTRA
jgi:hypothetical protein